MEKKPLIIRCSDGWIYGLFGYYEEAVEVAERIRLAIAALQIAVEGCTALQVTASIGAAALQPDETIDQLVARADEAMYLGKQQGRNQVNIAASAPSQPDKEEFGL